MKPLLAMFLFLGLTSCDKSIDEIERNRAIWMTNEPRAYSYTIQVSGWRSPPDLLHPKRVTVNEGDESAAYVWQSAEHEVGDNAFDGTYWSIAAVFDELVAAKHLNARVRARFNKRFGFVERAFVDYHADSSGWDVEIRDFEDPTGGVQ